MRDNGSIWPEVARGLAFAIGFTLLCVAGGALATFLSGCGGAPFALAAVDAGESNDDVEAGSDSEAPPLDGPEVEMSDGGKPPPVSDAAPLEAAAVDAGELLEAAAVDAGVDDASADAAARLCCHIECGQGTLPPGAGWSCSAGACAVGGACMLAAACGVVVACP